MYYDVGLLEKFDFKVVKYAIQKVWGEHMLLILLLLSNYYNSYVVSVWKVFLPVFWNKKSDTLNEKICFFGIFFNTLTEFFGFIMNTRIWGKKFFWFPQESWNIHTSRGAKVRVRFGLGLGTKNDVRVPNYITKYTTLHANFAILIINHFFVLQFLS